MTNKKCKNCKKDATYEIKQNKSIVQLCDYCFHILKWKNPEQEYIVESHLSTKESMQLYYEAITKFIVPQMKNLITKEQARLILEGEKKSGMNFVMNQLKENHQELIKNVCIKNNLNYPELIKSLRIYAETEK
jgi:hypothetical protein